MNRFAALLFVFALASPALAESPCKPPPPPTPEPTVSLQVTRDEFAFMLGGLQDRMDLYRKDWLKWRSAPVTKWRSAPDMAAMAEDTAAHWRQIKTTHDRLLPLYEAFRDSLEQAKDPL
jgi:hypothetical protein